ncbi:MAG: 4-(cytidine 5'-diphospho)-2-C-methyl-D-erythritol kinase [Aquificaceae bacterium]|uniref:4-(cytidine 5'-diphospho)-2-C-methyl-D-erythritol kinase n=1 Tax=Hydrogenobacter sp. Uz 6-8 TaxID=3384828 RepID=UPI00309D13C7
MLRLLSPAKVNLGLWLLGKRADGYHEVFTIYQAVDLFDEVLIEEGPLSVETSTGIPMEQNLVYKALRVMEGLLGKEISLRIFIQKNIPEGGGLGGGSSNVATVLRAVNELMGNPLSEEELYLIAGRISSDAPFFLLGGAAIGRGRGEILERLELPRMTFTLIHPGIRSSTAHVYSMVREEMLTEKLEGDKIIDCLRAGDFSVLQNRLGELAGELYPEVGEVLRFLRGLGMSALVSGSGSSVFYVGEPTVEVELACRARGWRLYRVESYGV